MVKPESCPWEAPSRLLLKLSQRLFEAADEREAFIDRLLHPQPFHPCILWCRERPEPLPFAIAPPLDWQPPFVDRLAMEEKPGQHPLHHEGFFYCLDFSSVFAISVLLTIPKPISLLVDVCASPGGKSIFAWVALRPTLLMSNEVIGKRTGALISNLKRCGVSPAIASRLDAKILAESMPNAGACSVVDAPCTGQSLLAKGDKAPGCFHPASINANANRQKRILANSAQLVAPGGYLAYMTCAYSPEENEKVIEWLLNRFPHFKAVSVPHLAAYQSQMTPAYCYRLFPQQNLGAGAFTALLQNTNEGEAAELPQGFLEHILKV